MAHAFPSFGGPGVLLFDEDFDVPAAAPEPEVILPVFSAAELMAARDEAAQNSRDSALAEAEVTERAVAGRTLAQIAAQITESRLEAMSIAEQSAEAIARLLLDCFATAFPALSARHGPAELAAVLREILPALHREPKITVRISPHMISAMTEEIHSLDADLLARVRLVPTDAVAPGDARITWENGAAIRDAASLWEQIENILAPAGLLNVRQTVKEQELVE
jgi:flagellar biosynthesis/type III secretory pathway protein FliH